ncbi:Gfo/Idh/MocA family oxidoreductase [Georgenia daeguensis]|uniref:Gfo/Idh/MocA family oxidoreductase n=1 Tax=Georgenia daeguensis TaxID=908355 RepID=A0ABP8EV96_9MICO
MTRRRLRIGVVGAGNASSHHLAGWRRLPGCDVVHIVDAVPERAERRAREYGVPRSGGNVHELVDSGAVDALDVITPAHAHAEIVEHALASGIHVLCQKPVADTREDIARIYDAAVAGPGRLMIHENWRYRSWFRELRRRIDGDELGTVFHLSSSARFAGTVTTPQHPDTPFSLARQPFFAEMDRFLILESVIHQLDVTRYLLGEPDVLYARAHRVSDRVRGEDVATVVLGYPGATAVVDRSYASKGREDPPLLSESVVVEGTAGTAFVSASGELRIVTEDSATRRVDVVPPEADPYVASYARAIRAFARGIITGAPFETDIYDNLSTMRLVLAAYESVDSGRTLGRAEIDATIPVGVRATGRVTP